MKGEIGSTGSTMVARVFGVLSRAVRLIRRFSKGANRGQAAVEMAAVATILTMAMVVGIQFAIIGEAALALGQASYQGARYAAVHSAGTTQSGVKTYVNSVGSPTIIAGNGQYLTVNVAALPCTQGSTVTVSLSFDAKHLVALPNPFLGVSFPTTLTNSSAAFCEGGT